MVCLAGWYPIELFAQGITSAHVPMLTRWSGDVSATNVQPQYPRPTMMRTDWLNLNGQWDYGLTQHNQTNSGTFNGKILVPFPVESQLSGVKRLFAELQRLWYRRTFTIPPEWHGQRVLLHFEGVNWDAKVWLNGKELGTHQGGYDRFSFDLTDALKQQGEQELIVSVSNQSDSGFQPRGKQMLHPHPPFYHAASGIWQTVWLEPVPATSIDSLNFVPDIDAGVLNINVSGRGETNAVTVKVTAFDGNKAVGTAIGQVGESFQLPVPQAKLWSPDNPFLYDLKVSFVRNGTNVDEVTSYFGMRKISVAKDDSGFPRLMLNNKRLFQFGPLDQGYWPDGIYTAPCDDALKSDIETMKQLGFNMCRKHVKIEPERWYYWCDKLGLLVWQDMPNGDHPTFPKQKEIQRKPESAREFEKELKQMIVQRGNHPCIVMWIAFNQGWGQYDTIRITDMIKNLDPSRLVVDASGWNDFGVGDVRSVHQYVEMPKPEHDGRRPYVVGECGGLGLVVTNHVWGPPGYWNTGYQSSSDELFWAYLKVTGVLKQQEREEGLSGAVFTQFSDVETEDNGFVTYDREVIKMPALAVKQINQGLINAPVTARKQ